MEETLTLQIDRLAHGGAGVARDAGGRTVFVRGTCPGDTVLARVLAEHPRWAEAEVAQVIDPSPDRVEAPCPYFGTCGGCSWQHVAYPAQAAAKRDILADSLKRIGRIEDGEVAGTLRAGPPYGYRNKIELGAGTDARGGLVLGMREAHTETLVPIDSCLLLPERARDLPRALSGALRYLSRGGPLGLSRVVIRVAAHTRDLEIDLWAAPGPFPRAAAARTLAKAVSPDTITRVLVKDPARDRGRAKVEVLAGRGSWRERLSGRGFRVSAPSFFQVNTAAAEALVTLVMEEAGIDGTDTVLDLYAGVGTFTLPAAAAAGGVVAIESSGPALRDLRANLDEAGLDADIVPGDAARAMEQVGHVDVAIVDPPRAGLDPDVARALARAHPRRIMYVSCDPATLARDVERLRGSGYELVSATPVDLFPQTWHTETVAVLDAV